PDEPAPADQQQPNEEAAARPASEGDGSLFGKRLLQSAVDAVPGAYYARLAQEQSRQGNYGAAAIYETAAFGDAALGAATLGASSRLGAGARAARETLTPVAAGIARKIAAAITAPAARAGSFGLAE